MIEVRRAPKPNGKPEPQRYSGARRITFDWKAVRTTGQGGKILWACLIDENDRAIAEEFVQSGPGIACGAQLVDVDAPSPLATPEHDGVSLAELRTFYDAVPAADRAAYLKGHRPAGSLPQWALKVPPEIREALKGETARWPHQLTVQNGVLLDTVPPDVIEILNQEGRWPLEWSVASLKQARSDQPMGLPLDAIIPKPVKDNPPTPRPAALEEVAPKPGAAPDVARADSSIANEGGLSGYGTEEETARAIMLIEDILRETPDPSSQKVAHRLRTNNLPPAGEHMDALIGMARSNQE